MYNSLGVLVRRPSISEIEKLEFSYATFPYIDEKVLDYEMKKNLTYIRKCISILIVISIYSMSHKKIGQIGF